MRLLLVADLHYSLPQFDWVLDMAPDFDVVVMAGDHLDLGSIVDGRAQSVVVRKYFSRLRAKTSIPRTRPARRPRAG
jgi:Icc-related predicted phosphoesterase